MFFLMPGFNSHKDYWADYGENLVVIGEAFSDATTGLVVPTYVTINSIEVERQ
jgi:glycine betaine/proline transport system substrate-binding protein